MDKEKSPSRGKLRHLLFLSLLTAMALTLFLVEAQLPLPVGIAGVKLGLSNLVTLFLLVKFSLRDAAAVMGLRIFLGNLFTGQVVSLLYSLAGGVLSLLVMLLFCRMLKGKSVWFVSIMGGTAHNIGQILIAMCLLGVGGVVYYIPFLFVSGILMGLLTGLVTQGFLHAWERLQLR